MLHKQEKTHDSAPIASGGDAWLCAIDKMASLESGWLDGGGKPVGENLRRAVKNFILSCGQVPEFYAVVPTEAGGILLEYKSHGWDYGIEFDPDESAVFFGVEIGGQGEFSEDFPAGARDALSKRIDGSLK